MKANSKKSGGSAKKMKTGGAPNANGYGKRATYASSIGSTMALDKVKQKANAKKTVTKSSPIKKKSSKKAMTDDQFDTYMNKKYGTMKQADYDKKIQNSTVVADTNNPSNVGKTRKEIVRGGKDTPVTMVKNEIVKIPANTSPEIKRTAMVPLGKKGGTMKKKNGGTAVSKMSKMTYRKGGSKKC